MAGFDPTAATAAYLSKIPPAVQAAAERHAEAGVLAWGLGWAGALLLAALMLRSGLVEGAKRGGGAGAVILLTALASCAWELAVRAMSEGALPAGSAAGFGLDVLVRAALLAAALGALRLAGGRRRLWLSAGAVAVSFLLVFGPTALSELAPHPRQSATGPAAAAALAAARDSGVAASAVEVSASAPGEGDVIGLLKPARVLLAPDAASEASVAEVRGAVGHVLGHYRARDGLGWAAVLAGLGVLGSLFVIGLCRPVGRLLGGRRSFQPRFGEDDRARGPADARRLPVLWALTACWIAIAQPAAFAWDRAVNLRADRFSLDHVREPEGLAAALVRENGLRPVDPKPVELWLTCSHPPLKARVDQAMRWKASQVR